MTWSFIKKYVFVEELFNLPTYFTDVYGLKNPKDFERNSFKILICTKCYIYASFIVKNIKISNENNFYLILLVTSILYF